MKVFRYAKGHVCYVALTVAELRHLLSEYPDEMPVFAEWEGVRAPLNRDDLRVESVSCGMEEDRRDCLVFDVNTR